MTDNYDLVLLNGEVMLPDGLSQCNVGVKNGKIAIISGNGNLTGDKILDCKGLHVLPGVIDSQCHFREFLFVHLPFVVPAWHCSTPNGSYTF